MNVLPIQAEMTTDLFVACLFVGAALLAAWVLVRFEEVGPRSLTSAITGWVVSGLLIVGLPALIQGAFSWGLPESLPESRLLVVFVLILPIFTYFFLAGAWFIRTLLKFAMGVR